MRGPTKEETEALRAIALQHNLTATTGPMIKDGQKAGNPSALLRAIISGDVATVLMSEDVRTALIWLAEQRSAMESDAPQTRGLDQLIAALWMASARKVQGSTMDGIT